MDFLAQVVVWLNVVANALGRFLLAPLAVLPGWLSATVVATVTGVLFLVIFKYTSHQRAIKRVKDDIKANLLALKLFKDSASVALRAQGRILLDAWWLFVFAVVPMLAMLLPVLLMLGQLALWYQSRPLHVGEDAVLTLKLNGHPDLPLSYLCLEPIDAFEPMVGPVRLRSRGEICWKIRARAAGYHHLTFHVGDLVEEKELVIGDGFRRVSIRRPGWSWSDALRNPWEKPFGPDSPIQSIDIAYPERPSWTCGTDKWVIYWFVVSMVAGLCFRRLLNVHI
jgi:hypothetical protein